MRMLFLLLALALLPSPQRTAVAVTAPSKVVSRVVRPGVPRPDIVIFVIDDVADSDVDAVMGAGWMPNLATLASRGVRYRRAYAHAKCAPTRDSLYYSTMVGYDRGDACAPPLVGSHHPLDYSIAHMMAGQGYATCHIGKFHVGSSKVGDWKVAGEMMGWGSVRATVPVGPTCNVAGADQPILDDGVYSTSGVDSTVRCRDAFIDWWTENEGRPRFVVVEFGSAHAPFRYPSTGILPQGYPPCGINCPNRKEFEAEIAGVDYVMGQMLALLGPEDWAMYLGDNGTPGIVPGDDPAVTVATRPDQDPSRVKLTCYEDGVRVPLVIAGPGVSAGESQAIVHVADLMPTVAQIVGIKPTVPVQGRAIGATLIGLPGPQAPVFVWNPPPRLDSAMIGPRWKLLTREDGVEELYDLQSDPHEQFPLAPTGPEAEALRQAREALFL